MTVLATRASLLARAQAELVAEGLRRLRPGQPVELALVRSDGDLEPSTEVSALEGQGWFTSRLEQALSEGRVDGAVHSAKDLPSQLASGLTVGAYLKRGDPRDAVVCSGGRSWRELPAGARLGTSSPRRAAQLRALRPDLEMVPMRGNLDSRLRRVERGELDGVLVARAGLVRIGRGDEGEALDPHLECTPAPAQAAIALQVASDSSLAELAAGLDDAPTRACVEAERLVLERMGGGCRLPLGALAEEDGAGGFTLTVAWAPDVEPPAIRRSSGAAPGPGLGDLAARLARELLR